jgi:hypothetical protein
VLGSKPELPWINSCQASNCDCEGEAPRGDSSRTCSNSRKSIARIEIDSPTPNGDAMALCRVQVNLLDNAMKFTPGGGRRDSCSGNSASDCSQSPQALRPWPSGDRTTAAGSQSPRRVWDHSSLSSAKPPFKVNECSQPGGNCCGTTGSGLPAVATGRPLRCAIFTAARLQQVQQVSFGFNDPPFLQTDDESPQ